MILVFLFIKKRDQSQLKTEMKNKKKRSWYKKLVVAHQ